MILADNRESDGLKIIDLGAGHSSSGETLYGRVITALKSQALLNESIGAGYIERNWPPALKESGAWPLAALLQSFLNGSLTRLLDPDNVLRNKIVEFVMNGDFGLASGQKPDGTYERVWYREMISRDEVSFESDVFLLLKKKAEVTKSKPDIPPVPEPPTATSPESESPQESTPKPISSTPRTFHISGEIPPEIWNRFGTKILPKLRNGTNLKVGINFVVTVEGDFAQRFEAELQQILEDMGLRDQVQIR
jgi:hypothetical protein